MVPGIYKGRPVEAVLASTENNKEYIGITFENDADGEYPGSCITAQLWWTDKAKPYTKAALDRLGWKGEVRTVNGQCHLVLPDASVPYCVKQEEYNGRTSLKVDWIVSPPSGVRESDKLTGKAAAAFLGELRGPKVTNGAANGNGRNVREEYGPGADDF